LKLKKRRFEKNKKIEKIPFPGKIASHPGEL
jgi:hypothetical protein